MAITAQQARVQLREQGWWASHPDDPDDSNACDDCGTTTRPVRCVGCTTCKIFVCVSCVLEHERIPLCLVNLGDAVAAASAQIPALLESLKSDAAITAVELSESFDECDDADTITWVKSLVQYWEIFVQFMSADARCTKCKGPGPGVLYVLTDTRAETQCVACIVQKRLLRESYMREIEFKGITVVAYFPPPPTFKSARKH